MLAGLRRIGHVTETKVKTTVLFAPKVKVGWQQIRNVLEKHLDPKKGNVFYVNLRTLGTFQWGSRTRFKWKKVG